MDLILDTNALSMFAEGDRDVTSQISSSDAVSVPVIVLGEYRFGILQSRYRQQHERWLAGVLPTLLVLPVDDETAVHYASIRLELKQTGTPIPTNDLWIAALCRQHNFSPPSRDHHFDRVKGVHRVSW